MRLRLGRLKRVIDEAVGDDRYMDEEQARMFIMDRDGDEVADSDIIDEDTGEIYIEAGQTYEESPWSPDHTVDKRRAERDETYARRAGVWDEYWADDEDDEVGIDDVIARQLEQEFEEKQNAREAFQTAVDEWAKGWGDSWLDLKQGMGTGQPLEPADVAYDAADSFFFEYRQKWRRWAYVLGIDGKTMKEILADYAHDAMVKADKDA